jgi:hypothetical protein
MMNAIKRYMDWLSCSKPERARRLAAILEQIEELAATRPETIERHQRTQDGLSVLVDRILKDVDRLGKNGKTADE